MACNRFRILALAAALVFSAALSQAAVIVGAVEDLPGGIGMEKNGDFNDLMFEMMGDLSIIAPGGVYNDLTPSVVNESGTVFWDNPSLDGDDQNVGYQLLGDTGLPPLQYLAAPGGGSANNISFDSTGTISMTFLGGIAGNALFNTLGWYDPSNPTVLHPLIGGWDGSGYTVTFDPSGQFVLYMTDGSWGQTYSSIASSNIDESGTHQHFALFQDPPPAQTPEPASAALAGFGVTLMALEMFRRRTRKL